MRIGQARKGRSKQDRRVQSKDERLGLCCPGQGKSSLMLGCRPYYRKQAAWHGKEIMELLQKMQEGTKETLGDRGAEKVSPGSLRHQQ